MKCRICQSDSYKSVLDLGLIHPSGFSKDGAILGKTPLHLVRCTNCKLVQLESSVNLDLMYKDFYWYRSATNPSMITALRDIVRSAMSRVILEAGDIVCDIGANDLTLLNCYPDGFIKVAYEPASNLAEHGKYAHYYINDYFSADSYPLNEKARIITSIAMLYDLENPRKFIKDIAKILRTDGIWIVQFTDLYETIKNNDFTNICQEHLIYYSTDILIRILAEQGLEIFDMERNNVNGGSVRLYIRHKTDKPKSSDYYLLLGKELDYLSMHDFVFTDFKNRVINIKEKLNKYLKSQNIIYALGASTKSGTFLQYCKISNIRAIGEVSESKIGLKNVTGTPIVHENEILKINPPIILVLTWQYKWFFVNKLQDYIANGGTVLFPLPLPEIITKNGIQLL